MPDERDFSLHHRTEIVGILERMRIERILTTVDFAGDNTVVTTVLEVSRDANTLVFGIARDPAINRILFSAAVLAFRCELDHIQITFETGTPAMTDDGDGAAAIVAFPLAVVRLQRREWFRAALPVQPPIRCTVLDPHGNASAAQAVDLSCGGTSLVVDDPSLAGARPGSGHELILSLPEVGRIELDATLRTVRSATAMPGVPPSRLRLGFRFDEVPAKTSGQIQRYVQHLEVTQLRMLRQRRRRTEGT